MDKVIRNGNVGVLVTYDYGAGWYTWHDIPELLFEPEVIRMVEESIDPKVIEEYCVRVYGDDHYYGGADNLMIEWVPEGTVFRIEEYDGRESLVYLEEYEWITA